MEVLHLPRQIRLRTALMIPFLIFVSVLIGLLVFVWQKDYDWLAKEQGTRLVNAVNASSIEKLEELLLDPERVNSLYASTIRLNEVGEDPSLAGIQDITKTFMETAIKSTPQIAVISYGDEKGRFVGLRVNEDKSISLMLKDERTEERLNIYENAHIDSPIIGTYEGYDPRVRPWYAPVKTNPQIQWSEIYINADEQMNATISSLVPVFKTNNEFIGVADIDIRLDGISSFLKANPSKGSGVIYIVDSMWNVIAHSGNEQGTKLVKDASGNPVPQMSKAYQHDNVMIKTSAAHLESMHISPLEVTQVQMDHETLYIQMQDVEPFGTLKWRVITVIPERDLLGSLREHQLVSLWIILLMALIVGFIGFAVIGRIAKPVKLSAEAAVKLASGNYDIQLEDANYPISEVRELTGAFNHMADRIKENFELLQNSEEGYRTLVENVEDMIYNVTPAGVFIAVNSRFEREVGLSRDEILGQPIDLVFSKPKDKLFWQEQLLKAASTQTRLTYQYAYIKRNGQRRVYNVSLTPQKDIGGRVTSILGSNTDITDLIDAQEEISNLHEKEKATLERMVDERTEELKTAMDELIEREKLASLGGLVSGIAHEINTPLGVSISAASYLETINNQIVESMVGGKMTKTQLVEFFHNLDETAKILNSNLYRASELVKSFKEISISQITEDLSRFNVKEYLEMILLSLKHEYKRSGHTIEVLCDENLIVYSYPGVFAQIMTNLMMNALVHGLSHKEGGQILIEVTALLDNLGQHNGDLRVHFYDNGIGIPKANISKIFEPFFTTNRERGGSGLGLNVVYNLVTGKLGGKITCESQENKGTHFYITIPKVSE